ncbi:hypothetical protein O59_002929 [Cellvibrio sp. BR]|nr:hypothetical protein O59_002929 [Cellvibrio sp. BR]
MINPCRYSAAALNCFKPTNKKRRNDPLIAAFFIGQIL